MKGSLEAIRYSGAGLFFFAAVLLALVAGFTVYGYLSSAVPSTEVVTVTRDLSPGATIAAADVALIKLPASAIPDGASHNLKDVVGRRIRYGLASGDYLRKQHLVEQGASDVATKLSEKGEEFRAVMLPGELVPALDRLLPGDRLELTGVLPVQDQRSSSTIAVPLGVGSVLDVQTAKGQTEKSAVLVAMRTSEVSRLALTLRVGTLMVAVQGNEQASQPAPALRLETLTGAGAAAAAQAPAGASTAPTASVPTPGTQKAPAPGATGQTGR